MARAGKGIEYCAPERGKTHAREATGRRCCATGCETVLSTYNHADTCFTHTVPVRLPPRR